MNLVSSGGSGSSWISLLITFQCLPTFAIAIIVPNHSNPITQIETTGGIPSTLPSSPSPNSPQLTWNYIASRLKKIVMMPSSTSTSSSPKIERSISILSTPQEGEGTPSKNNLTTMDFDTLSVKPRSNKKGFFPLKKAMMGSTPLRLIPEGEPTPKWVPGELIAFNIMNSQIKMLNEGEFGPLKMVTKYPTLHTAILVFNKRYDPERLAQVVKFNYGVEAVPNGVVQRI